MIRKYIFLFLAAMLIMPIVQSEAKDAKQSPIYYSQGLEANKKGDFDSAVTLLNKAKELEPSYADTYFQLGIAYMGKKQFSEATAAFQKYLKTYPRSAEAYQKIGQIYLMKGDFNSAYQYFQRALKVQPSSFAAHFGMGDYYLALASKEYFTALETDPKDRETYNRINYIAEANATDGKLLYNLGELYKKEGDLTRAYTFYKRASDVDPRYNEDYFISNAKKLASSQKVKESLEELKIAYVVFPKSPKVRLAAGEILLRQNRFSEAEKEFTEYLTKEVTDINGYLLLAKALEKQNKNKEAAAVLEKALGVKNSSTVHTALGKLHKKEGNIPLATAEFEKALQLNPSDAEAKKELESAKGVWVAQKEKTREEKTAVVKEIVKEDKILKIPESLVSVAKPNFTYLIYDKENQTLFLYKTDASGKASTVKTYQATHGNSKGDKSVSGDRKTPEGVYILTERLYGRGLPEKYGKMAFTLNYPNRFDKLQGKDGKGIWLHSSDKDLKSILPGATDGCVVVNDKSIIELDKFISVGKTPIIITASQKLLSHGEWEKQKNEITGFIDGWRKAWQNKDIEKYQNYYSKSFSSDGRDFKRWIEHKKGVFANNQNISVELSNFEIVKSEKTMIARFFQDYKGDRLQNKGYKTLFILNENGNGWKIVAEEWGTGKRNEKPAKEVSKSKEKKSGKWKTSKKRSKR